MANVTWSLMTLLFILKVVFISVESIAIGLGLPLLLCVVIFFISLSSRSVVSIVLGRRVFPWVAAVNIIVLWGVLISLLNGTYNVETASSFVKFIVFQALILYGVFSAHVGRQREFYSVIYALLLLHIIGGILGPMLNIGMEEIEGVIRYHGFAGKINTLANLALFSMLYYFVQYHVDRRGRHLVIALLSLCVIVLTGTMKNMLIAAFLLPFLVLNVRGAFLYAPLVCLVSAASYFYFNEHVDMVLSRFVLMYETGVSINIEHGEKVGNSLNWRILHWRLLINDWYPSNFLIGVGLGGYLSLGGLLTSSGDVFDPHNDWLKLLLEFGLFGWMVLVLVAVRIAIFLFKNKSNIYGAKALFFALMGLYFSMFAANVIFSLAFFYFFLPMFGVVAYGSKMSGREVNF